MDVYFYGVRGSIPVPGPDTVRYGGNTISIQVRLSDGTLLFIDAGTGLRQAGIDLERSERPAEAHLLLSHLHIDHLLGLPFFQPLFRSGFKLLVHPVFSDALPDSDPRSFVFNGIHTPLALEDLPAEVALVSHPSPEWRIGSATVRQIQVNHPGGSQAFRVDDADGASFTFMSDMELRPEVDDEFSAMIDFAAGTDLLLTDAQFLDEERPARAGWGHSFLPDALLLGAKADPHCHALFHHDPGRTDSALDRIAEQVRIDADAEGRTGRVFLAKEGAHFRVEAGRVESIPVEPTRSA